MHPILLSIGDFNIAWYGALTATGLLAGALLALWLGKKRGVPEAAILDLVLFIVLGMVIGARGLYILTVFPEFLKDPAGHIFTRNGFVFLGGLVGATIATALYMRKTGLPFWRVADVFAPAVPLGHAIGRIGCHMTGCCHGGVCSTEAWYGIQVPVSYDAHGHVIGGYAALEQIDAKLHPLWEQFQSVLPPAGTLSLPIYPIQLFEAACLFALAAALLWLALKRPGWPGRVFLTYVLGYSAIRYGLEEFRGDSGRGVYNLGVAKLSASQALGLALAASAAWGLWLGSKGKLPGMNASMPVWEEAEEAPAPVAPPGARSARGKGDAADAPVRGAAKATKNGARVASRTKAKPAGRK